MAKNPIANMMAQAVAPGPVQNVPPGKIGGKSKSVPVPKGVQRSAPQGPPPGKPAPAQPKPTKGFGGRPAPAPPFGKKPSGT